MQPELPSLLQQLSFLLSHPSCLPEPYRACLPALSHPSTAPFCSSVHIQTLYSLSQPAYHSLDWQAPNQQVKYPVCFLTSQKGHNAEDEVQLDAAMWVESGGARCVGLRTEDGVADVLGLTHCGVVQGCDRELVARVLAGKDHSFPVLFIGEAAVLAMSTLQVLDEADVKKGSPGLAETFASFDSMLLRGLDISCRLSVQASPKIASPAHRVTPEQIKSPNNIKCCCRINNQQYVCIWEDGGRNIFCLLSEPYSSTTPDSIQFWHCVITNLVDAAKAGNKEVDQRKVEKRLLAHAKLVERAERRCYVLG